MKALAAFLGVVTICIVASVAATDGAASEPTVDFQRDIEPIVAGACLKCHGATEPQGQLRLDSQAAALAGGFSGAAIVPGNSEESVAYQRIASADPDMRMPHRSDPLPPEKIALVRLWIEQGANWPVSAAVQLAKPEKHWAYVKPIRPQPAEVKDASWPRNPIDTFILARLEKDGIVPSPEASKEQWLRRVSLDLTGLPPALADVDAFLADPNPDAYEKMVDRLLASPHYGERWAQPWLDAARYADSNGFTNDRQRSIWPYRDWVINALNDDLPFDQFTVEQIAGDLLPNATVAQQIATGFHRNTMFNDEQGVDQGEARWNAMIDRVGTTATVWLGTTLACAQCHNHKYDPFSQRDFYGLLAFFENIDYSMEGDAYNRKFIEPMLDLAPLGQQQQRRALEAEIASLQKKLGRPSNPGGETGQADPQAAERQRLDELKLQAESMAKQYPQTLVLRERSAPGPVTTFLRIKGGYLNKGDQVSAAVPGVLHPLPPGAPLNRLTLARWLVDHENPLTARVIVNRHWSQFFGRGLVETEEDFGTRGAAPSHPELLDWLATEFIRLGWSNKQLHKLIVMSATYRRGLPMTPNLLERDPQNRLFAHGPRFRLNAELVRDVTLAISGLLSDKIGGPSVFPPQPEISSLKDHGDFVWTESSGEDRFRRGIYTFWRRSAVYPALLNFDAPSRDACTVKRIQSNTPLQALTLLNDSTAAEAAAALAKRIRTEAPSHDVSDRANFAFRLCTCRWPTSRELAAIVRSYHECLSLMQQDTDSVNKIVTTHTNELGDDADFAAWFLVSQALLNLDETLSKE